MENKVLATVAGEEITEAEFEAFLQNVPREQQAYLSNPAMRSHYLDQLVALHLFAKDGADQKLDETEEFKSMIANAKRDILAQLSMAEALKTATVSVLFTRKIKISLQKAEPFVRNTSSRTAKTNVKRSWKRSKTEQKPSRWQHRSIPPVLPARKAEILANLAEARW